MIHSKHDRLIGNLKRRLEETHQGCIFLSNYVYRLKNKDGEADLIMADTLNNFAYAFEIKSTNSNKAKRKAKLQLSKDRGYIKQTFHITRVYTFYVYGYPKSPNKYHISRRNIYK